MSITVRFACDHSQPVARVDTGTAPPICRVCGERRIRHVDAPPPNVRGRCTGPSARPEALEALPISVAPQGPLPLKESTHGL